ncbi:tRNA dihydrouridine synthase [Haloimpatiens sp. FM7315]|uniref:tRNA dihydrouridine synthase n=1 Tax=Haloimpatiens sp. FM7315 TaxID=3298609 RepID=UPI00370A3503
MKFYFAPLEGITGYIYRNAYEDFFGNVDKYVTPFIATNQNRKFSSKELNDILPEHNRGLVVIPQILSNKADDFIYTANQLKSFGYDEINLNLGCPSGTVVAKNKGAGFLSKKGELNKFLEQIFLKAETKISVKTRIGINDPEEFYELIQIFNNYPIEELIIHPRVQKDYYKNKPNMKVFKDALNLSSNKVCYNGDIFTYRDFKKFTEDLQNVDTIMLGRGLISNPGLIYKLKGESKPYKATLREFHQRLYEDYKNVMSGDRNVLFKMKELWFYMIHIFSNYEKYFKHIKKCNRLIDYDVIVSRLFEEEEILEDIDLLFLKK